MEENNIFLGPSTGEGMSAIVEYGISTTEDEYFDNWLIYHISGIESIESRTPDGVGDTFGGFVHINFVNGASTHIEGSIKTVKE